ncbi:MAG: phosphoglycerate dehydrogenase [Deltaproteobacteria bacterium]|nr:phosphoglycerate dehydrogenase [Deltaproteobacteria bacterium]
MPDLWRVLVTCDLGREALERFSARPGFSVDVHDVRREDELVRAIPGYQAVIVRSNVEVTARAIAAGSDLLVVGRAGVGVDNIDVEAATRVGVAVVNAPGGNIVTTGEHAVAMLLSLARRIPQATASVRAGRWEKKKFMGRELRGKTLGIIGVGRVGSVVAEIAQCFRLRVLAADPYLSQEKASRLGVELCSLDALLAQADFLTVHTPLTPETRGLLGREAFSKMKPGVLVVNCARGGIVDEEALEEALESGRVGGAALDVFESEPPPPKALYQRPDVILTPHLGASTVEAQAGVAVEVAENVIAYLTTGAAPNSVNAPAAAGEALRRLEPYLDLAERLGRFLGQLVPGPVASSQVSVLGEAADQGPELVTASFLKGLLSPALSVRVNLVNAAAVARERGVRVATTTSLETQDFSDLISVRVEGPWGRHVLEGTLFGKREPRLVRFDEYRLDALPEGNLILIYNDDVPGVIGDIGTCLGAHHVNIAGMYNGRAREGGRAITLVNVDSPPTPEVLDALAALPHIQSVKQIIL